MRRRYLSLCMAIALTLTSVFPYGAAAEEVIPTPAVEVAEEAETADLSANALDETEAPAAEAPTGEEAEAQEQEDAQASVNEEDAQTAAEEQTPMSAEDAQASEPAQIAPPEESFDEEEAIVGDAEELPQEESAEDADAQDVTDGENAPFDTAAINLADSQISVEAASVEADPMLTEEGDNGNEEPVEWRFGTKSVNNTYEVLPSGELTLTAFVSHCLGKDEEGDETFEDLSDAHIDWSIEYIPDEDQEGEKTVDPPTIKLEEDADEWDEEENTLSSKCTIKTENATEGEYEIAFTVKKLIEEDTETTLHTFYEHIWVTSEYCNLEWEIKEGNNKSLLPNLEPGKSITVSPKWMFYSSDEKEPQQITEGVWYKWIFDRDYDCEKCEDFPLAVQAKKDGKDVDPAQATNEYGWYNAEAVDAFEITKLHDCWADATLVVIGEVEGASGDPEVEIPEGYVWMGDLYQSFDSMGYDIWSEENSVDIYTGGEGTIAISGNRAYGNCASDAEIVWSAEGVDAEKADNIISALPKELTTYNTEIDDNVGSGSVSAEAVSKLGVEHLKLRADLVIDGYEEPLDTETIAVHVIPSSVRFNNIPNENCSRLLGDVISIGTTEEAWVEDQDHPEGDNVYFTIQDVSVTSENDVLRCTQRTPEDGEDSEDGEPWWDIECRKPGTGEVTVTYYPKGGDSAEPEEITFTIEVSGRTYDMEVLYESSTDQMLSGTTMYCSTKLTETVLDIENRYENDVQDYTLEDLVCTRFSGSATSSEEFVQVKTDGTNIVVTAKQGMWGWAEFQVSAYVPESDKPVATTNFTVNVQDSYLVLTADLEKKQIGLGETLALAGESTGGESVTVVKPQVMCYWIDEEGNEREPEPYEDAVTYHWEFDGAAWESDGENDLSITRTGADGTSVDLVAEAGNGWRSNLHYDFDPIWYDEFGFGEDHYDWFYDENAEPFDLTLTGIPQDLPENCSMEIRYELTRGDVDYVTVAKGSEKLTLSLKDGVTPDKLEGYVFVEAYLWCGKTMVGQAGVDVAIRNASDYPWYEFSFNDYEYKIGESLDLMKDEAEGGYPAWVTVYDRGTPDGKPLKVIITGVVPGSYNDEVVEVKEEDGILRFVLKGMSSNEEDEYPGCTGVYVTFKNADGYEYKWSEDSLYFQLWCRDEVCDLKVRAGEQEIREDNVVQMLLDDELQFSAELVHQIYDQETQQFADQETEYELLYKSPDSEIIEVAEDGLVTAKEAGDATLFLFAVDKGFSAEVSGVLDKAWYEEDDTELGNLNEYIICEEKYPITVQASYYSLDVADNPIYMESGKAVMVTPTLTVRSILESMDGTAAKGTFTYRCEADPNYFTTSVEENTITITAGQLRLDKEDLEVTIIAYNERGDEVARCILPVIICKQHDMQETVKKAATCVAAGEAELVCSKCGYTETKEISATGHTPGDWKTVSPATTEAPEKQQRTCTVCGTVIEERTVGEKLQPSTEAPSTPSTEAPSTPSTEATGTGSAQTPGTESAGAGSGTGAVQEPFIELNATSIPMKLKQSTKVIKVKMAEGDSIVSWESSNKKVVTVTKKGKIKAKKKGKATITVTLASGKTASFVVKVQKNKVTTKKVTGVTKKITLAKGKKYKLTPVLKPLTSQDKITYTSSNKKVATVDKKGNIQAKGKGTAKITVKSGKKKAICTVTVK